MQRLLLVKCFVQWLKADHLPIAKLKVTKQPPFKVNKATEVRGVYKMAQTPPPLFSSS